MQSMFEEDWFMRQIKTMAAAIAKVIFGKDTVVYEIQNPANQTETDILYGNLVRLINDGKINEAEDLLFQSLDPNNQDMLLLAVDFYQRLNALGDPALQACGFSRQEILDGMQEVQRIYGLEL